jgi:hypothetical protein
VSKFPSLLLAVLCVARPVVLAGGEPSKPALRLRGAAIIASSETSPAIRHALRDLAGDCEKVLGQPARLVEGTTGTVVVRLDASLLQPEGWRIEIDSTSVVISGTDPLGAVYGIYCFSERFLGVDPLWFSSTMKTCSRNGSPAAARGSWTIPSITRSFLWTSPSWKSFSACGSPRRKGSGPVGTRATRRKTSPRCWSGRGDSPPSRIAHTNEFISAAG